MSLEYTIKELTKEDLAEDKDGFLETLENLSETGEISLEEMKWILLKIKSQEGKIFIAKTNDGKIIGTAKLLVEQKFIHQGGRAGRLEDVAVRKEYEGNGIASGIIMNYIIPSAKEAGCYKLILDCNDKNVPFYKKLGFYVHEHSLRLDLKK